MKGWGKARKRRERGGTAKTRRGTGAARGRMLALRETWWCRDDIFRAAARVIDEYQMLSIAPWEKLMKQKKKKYSATTKDNVGIRVGTKKKIKRQI